MRTASLLLLLSSLARAQSADKLFDEAFGFGARSTELLWRAVEAEPHHVESWIYLSRLLQCEDPRRTGEAECKKIRAALVGIGCRDCLLTVAAQLSVEEYLALVQGSDAWRRGKRLHDAVARLRAAAKRLDTAPAAEIADLPIGLRTKAASKNAKTLTPLFAERVRDASGGAQPRAARIAELLGAEGNPPLTIGETIVCDEACCLLRAPGPPTNGARVPSVLCFDAKNRVDAYVEGNGGDEEECPRWMVPGERVFTEPLVESARPREVARDALSLVAARRAVAAEPSSLTAYLALYRALPAGAEHDTVRRRIATVDSVEARQLLVDEAKSFIELAERQPRHDCRSQALGPARTLGKILHRAAGVSLAGVGLVTSHDRPVELRGDPTGRTQVSTRDMAAWFDALAKQNVAASPAMFCPTSAAPAGLDDPPLNHCCRLLYPSSAPAGPRLKQVCVDNTGLTRIDF